MNTVVYSFSIACIKCNISFVHVFPEVPTYCKLTVLRTWIGNEQATTPYLKMETKRYKTTWHFQSTMIHGCISIIEVMLTHSETYIVKTICSTAICHANYQHHEITFCHVAIETNSPWICTRGCVVWCMGCDICAPIFVISCHDPKTLYWIQKFVLTDVCYSLASSTHLLCFWLTCANVFLSTSYTPRINISVHSFHV